MKTAMASPGRNSSQDREARISLRFTDTIPKMAVVPPCIMAVPSPRIALVSSPAALTDPECK